MRALVQASLVAKAPIRAEIDETLDRELNFAAQIAFYRKHIHVLTNALEFGVSEVFYFFVGRHPGRFADLAGTGAADTVNRSQPDLGVLMRWDVDASNTGHNVSLFCRLLNQP